MCGVYSLNLLNTLEKDIDAGGGGRPLIPLSIVIMCTVYNEDLIEERKLMIHVYTIFAILHICQ